VAEARSGQDGRPPGRRPAIPRPPPSSGHSPAGPRHKPARKANSKAQVKGQGPRAKGQGPIQKPVKGQAKAKERGALTRPHFKRRAATGRLAGVYAARAPRGKTDPAAPLPCSPGKTPRPAQRPHRPRTPTRTGPAQSPYPMFGPCSPPSGGKPLLRRGLLRRLSVPENFHSPALRLSE
jgi:hypothetical protein